MSPQKILVIKLRSLGDTVISTAPLLEVIRAYPNAQVHALVTQAWAAILNDIPGLTQIWPYQRAKDPIARTRAMTRLAYQLRKEKFDCVINLHASPSSATLAWATGARIRAIHFHGARDRNRYSTVLIPGKGIQKPIIERDMDTLRALGLHIPAGRSPQLWIQPHDQRGADQFLKDLPAPGPILGLGLGASRPTKSWPLERYAALGVEWCLKFSGTVIAFAGPSEGLLIQQFLQLTDQALTTSIPHLEERTQIRNRIHATSSLTLPILAGVLNRLAAWVGNDSGPKHLAIAIGTPTVTLFGPENPFEWHPYPKDQHPFLFIEHLACRSEGGPQMLHWCSLQTCTLEEHQCMKRIGIEPVLTQILKIARHLQPAPQGRSPT